MAPITINLLPNRIYPKLKAQRLEVGSSLGHDLSMRNGKIVASSVPKMVKGLGPCVGLAIFANKYKFVAHSAPEHDTNMELNSDFISRKINEVRTKGLCKDEDVTAVIYGGTAYDPQNPVSEMSCELVDSIEEGCKLEGVEPTIITGQFGDGLETRIDSYIGQNQITIWGKLIDKIKQTHNASQEEIQKVLSELFEYVKVGRNTEFKIVDKLMLIIQTTFLDNFH